MARSAWMVLVLGILGMGMLMLGMCVSLDTFAGSAAGARVKVAQGARSQFGFESAAAWLTMEGSKRVLHVSYVTRQSSGFDMTVQNAELERVGTYVVNHYDGTDKKEIDEIRVLRTEIRGRGCWQSRETQQVVRPNPHRKGLQPR